MASRMWLGSHFRFVFIDPVSAWRGGPACMHTSIRFFLNCRCSMQGPNGARAVANELTFRARTSRSKEEAFESYSLNNVTMTISRQGVGGRGASQPRPTDAATAGQAEHGGRGRCCLSCCGRVGGQPRRGRERRRRQHQRRQWLWQQVSSRLEQQRRQHQHQQQQRGVARARRLPPGQAVVGQLLTPAATPSPSKPGRGQRELPPPSPPAAPSPTQTLAARTAPASLAGWRRRRGRGMG